jgi:hypothetical protein
MENESMIYEYLMSIEGCLLYLKRASAVMQSSEKLVPLQMQRLLLMLRYAFF